MQMKSLVNFCTPQNHFCSFTAQQCCSTLLNSWSRRRLPCLKLIWNKYFTCRWAPASTADWVHADAFSLVVKFCTWKCHFKSIWDVGASRDFHYSGRAVLSFMFLNKSPSTSVVRENATMPFLLFEMFYGLWNFPWLIMTMWIFLKFLFCVNLSFKTASCRAEVRKTPNLYLLGEFSSLLELQP